MGDVVQVPVEVEALNAYRLENNLTYKGLSAKMLLADVVMSPNTLQYLIKRLPHMKRQRGQPSAPLDRTRLQILKFLLSVETVNASDIPRRRSKRRRARGHGQRAPL